MKNLFALVLVFALLLSGCGKNEEPVVVEPNEEPSEIENSETEEISEEFVEEIILNLGAEKLGDGTFRTSKTCGFFFNMEFCMKILIENNAKQRNDKTCFSMD